MTVGNDTLTLLSEGSHKAFAELFQAYWPKVRRFALALLKNPDDADDVAQMVFLRAWAKRESFAGVRDLDNFMFIMAKRTTLNFIATRHTERTDAAEIGEKDIPEDNLTPESVLEAEDLQLLVDMVVNGMPEQRRRIYRLSRERHMNNQEIADRLGIKKKTVENHLNLALNELRKAIGVVILVFLGWV